MLQELLRRIHTFEAIMGTCAFLLLISSRKESDFKLGGKWKKKIREPTPLELNEGHHKGPTIYTTVHKVILGAQ